ncbi:MAG: hypothetical protein ACI4TL_05140, partial [Candidatus Cryptobacteroides sp.]
MRKVFHLVLAALLACACNKAADVTKSVYSSEEQSAASRQLIERVVGKKNARAFEVRINPVKEEGKDWF